MVLTSLLIFSFLPLFSWTLGAQLDACLCLCFQQLLDEGSMVLFKVFISLTIGEGQYPARYCLGSSWASYLWISGYFSSARFLLLVPQWLPQSKYLSLYSHFCLSSISTILFSQVLFPLLFSPSLPLLLSLLHPFPCSQFCQVILSASPF